MLGTLGTQEIIFIFLLALLLFGPKKLPEIGRTVGKALGEFRRASSELKTTFDREMQNLETETGVKEIGNQLQYPNYNHDYSSYAGSEPYAGAAPVYEGSYGSTAQESASSNPPIISEPATQGAESPVAVAPEGTIAHGFSNEGSSEAGEHLPEATTKLEHNV